MYGRTLLLIVSGCLVVLLAGCQKPAEAGTETTVQEMVQYEGHDYPKAELSAETLEWLEWYQELPRETQMKISMVPPEFIQPVGAAMDTEAAKYVLYSAPAIYLIDGLSSQINSFEVVSGSYEWNYSKGEENEGLVACGPHPLDMQLSDIPKLHVPDYNGTDYVSYRISCAVAPDRITVTEWELAEQGNSEAEPIGRTEYEATTFVDLKKERIYEINAEWSEETFDNRGFSGMASYVLVTE